MMTRAEVTRNENTKGKDVISYAAMGNILRDFRAVEFISRQGSLFVTPIMTALFGELEKSSQGVQNVKRLLQGPTGVGKTSTLLYIGHMARLKKYVVFPVQARLFVNQADPMSSLIRGFLTKWIEAVGEDVVKEIFGNDIFELIERIVSTKMPTLEEEKQTIKIFKVIMDELRNYKDKPVIFLVDQCNVFCAQKQMIKLYSDSEDKEVSPRGNPVGALFLDWNTFQVNRGGIFYGFSSAFQLMPAAADGNAALFSKMEPMNRSNFDIFVEFLVNENLLPQECIWDDFFILCGGIPREAFEFGSEKKRLFDDGQSYYQQWKEAYLDARIPFYKTRIRHLLDKETLGPELLKQSAPFAASLFVGEKMASAPDVWIASGLIVKSDGFYKLFCPAAEKAILSVFDEYQAIHQAIHIFLSDSAIRWRSLELAVVYLFRRSRGIPIEFHCTDLRGKNKKILKIAAGLIKHGGTFTPAPKSIPRNTLCVCFRNTPSVDFFIHDANGAQILIQVSESCYQEHKAKYDPEDQDIKAYSESALDPNQGEKLQYIYLTSDPSLMTTGQSYRKDVHLVTRNGMKRLFNGLFG